MAETNFPTATAYPEGAERLSEEQREAMRGEPPFAEAPPTDSRLVRALKEAGITAGLIAVLTVFFFAFKTDIAAGGLALTADPIQWIVWIAIAFVGRFVLSYLVFANDKPTVGGWKKITAATAGWPVGKVIGAILLLVALTLPFLLSTFLPSQNRYLLDLSILILTYVMLGWGLNIVVGLAGLLDLGYVAFYAVGAYSFALLATNFDLGFWVCLPMAGLFAALWGVMLGFPVLRLRGDYLAIVTLAFGEIIRVVLLNWANFTGGPNGILGIPKPTLFGLEFNRGAGSFSDFFGIPYSPIQRFIFLYYIILALALLTNFVTMRMRKLPVGRAWEALREDEIACRSLGINTVNVKLTAFATGAMFGGFAGSFFATRQGFISPESFTFIESAIILAIVVLGGLGSQLGVVIASVVMIGGIELLRNLTGLQAIFGAGFDPTEYRMLIFGLAMVLIMVWKPRGLVSTRSPSAIYKAKKKIGADLVAQGEGH
ncbi:high-affinity branched-chain amino acid ABC transporter permease LivM [Jiella sp. MQZ9-1]|uniref:High-affinity branched-chain amino acid ABC transporter permease LivM n=1 Tax=Jiella flava TaxID=2816857 RepID=A0A939FTB1_9HYPH|nr:high-affinity branched-chain amino acid ABC transporter permease LivM [Jiella flava]MBO0661167.1 high-affinity branched-chain amino acid ABC transporter permease LivM [Jiella flava]MCD2469812.1 high-affinity branched-chain amino acid ABC transporter permease LivM [Jiella flava]